MRPFELLTLAALLLALVGWVVPARKRPDFAVFLPGVAALLIVVHLIVERYRWQMVPAYALAGALLLASLASKTRPAPAAASRIGTAARIGGVVIGLLVLTVAAALTWLMPVVALPTPTGPYAVGRTTIHMVDASRPETLTEDPTDVREFDAEFWYPAESTGDLKRAPYTGPDRRIDDIAEQGAEAIGGGGPPDFAFDYLALVGTNSYRDAPPARKGRGFPVVGFTPGFLSKPDNGQVFFEELASHGYVVFATSQPYENASVVRPDGTVVRYSAEHLAAFKRHMEEVPPLLKELYGAEDPGQKASIVRRILQTDTFFDAEVRIRAADVSFVLDRLQRMSSGELEGPFTGVLDPGRVGVFGHSLGGSTAGQLCVTDDRVDACVNLDGFPFGDIIGSSVEQPYMILYSESFSGELDAVFSSLRGPAFKATIAGTTHSDYCDEPYVMPIMKRIGMSGPIDAERMVRIVNGMLLSFFDEFVKGVTGAFPDETVESPEVEFEEVDHRSAAVAATEGRGRGQ